MIKLIVKYFQKTEGYSTGRFIVEMYTITLISKIVLSILFFIYWKVLNSNGVAFGVDIDSYSNSFLNGIHWVIGFIIICIIAPFFETIIGQLIPILISSRIFNKITYILGSSVMINTVLHYPFDIHELSILLFLSTILAWSFLTYMKEGYWKAIFVTATIHALNNFIPFVMIYTL